MADISAWWSEDPTRQQINRNEAIKRFCIARSERDYCMYCSTHVMHDRHYVNEQRAHQFDEKAEKVIVYLYKKYLRKVPIYQGYPAEVATDHIGLQPPDVADFRQMLLWETEAHG